MSSASQKGELADRCQQVRVVVEHRGQDRQGLVPVVDAHVDVQAVDDHLPPPVLGAVEHLLVGLPRRHVLRAPAAEGVRPPGEDLETRARPPPHCTEPSASRRSRSASATVRHTPVTSSTVLVRYSPVTRGESMRDRTVGRHAARARPCRRRRARAPTRRRASTAPSSRTRSASGSLGHTGSARGGRRQRGRPDPKSHLKPNRPYPAGTLAAAPTHKPTAPSTHRPRTPVPTPTFAGPSRTHPLDEWRPTAWV